MSVYLADDVGVLQASFGQIPGRLDVSCDQVWREWEQLRQGWLGQWLGIVAIHAVWIEVSCELDKSLSGAQASV